MRAHATLWVDTEGQLCEEPPARGLKIAPTKGDEIPPEFIKRYGLSEKEGKVVQKQQAKAENKAVKEAPNKGSGLTINKAVRSSGDKPAEPEGSGPTGEEASAEPEKPKAKKKKGSR